MLRRLDVVSAVVVGVVCSAGVHAQGASATPAEVTPSTIPDDLSLLIGKKVIVGRMPLCLPNTYTPNLSYNGKAAVVSGFKPYQGLNMINIGGLPPTLRTQM